MNKIFESSRIDAFTNIGDNVKVYKECDVQKSILNDYTSIGDYSIVRNSSLDSYVEIGRSNKILDSDIKKGTYTGTNTLISHAQIGKYCAISWNCSIGGANHDINNISVSPLYRIFRDEPVKSFESFNIPLEIGNDVWIASNVVIIRGVKIGDGAVIAAGAVVTKNVPPYSIVGGVPAKVIKYRFDDETIAKLEEIKWWDWSNEKLSYIKDVFEKPLNKEGIDKLWRIYKNGQNN